MDDYNDTYNTHAGPPQQRTTRRRHRHRVPGTPNRHISLHPCRRGAATGDQRLGGASSSGFDTHLRQGVPSDPALRVVAGHIAQAWVLVSWWSSEGFVQAAAPGMQPARNPSTTFAMSLSE
ncbi:hypothetical protein B0H14DRAFT_3530528 [Mycena olivaceomarginata]|nr:hypothetical protein B0H14DRAFT_3530528 [Mycena olivaceomarginata]